MAASIVSIEELPGSYYRWDALLEEVFEYAASRANASRRDNLIKQHRQKTP
jgi:hypothetical protein